MIGHPEDSSPNTDAIGANASFSSSSGNREKLASRAENCLANMANSS
jgi:hypothetical protein